MPETKTEWRVCQRRVGEPWRTQFYGVEDSARTAAVDGIVDGYEVRLQRREVTPWETVPAVEQVTA